MTGAVRTALILPFYNEEQRLDLAELRRLCAASLLSLVLIDDGSTDHTRELLAPLAAIGTTRLLRIQPNRGKGEAVRHGLLHAIFGGFDVVGYADGDLAAPVEELLRLAHLAHCLSGYEGVLGARVRLADRDIARHSYRHYLGRVIGTYIDLRYRLPVYDTQCGAKYFRTTPALTAALARPFQSRWLFDVELLVRLRREWTDRGMSGRLREEPLEMWHDVPGSHIRVREMSRVLRDFVVLERSLRADR